MSTQREKALKILYSIEFEGAYSNLSIKSGLENSGLDSKDKAFVTQLVYGVVSRKRALDDIILKYSSVKLSKLSKYVLLILRMGIYQIHFMDKVPPSAAVNESVKLASKFAARSKGFVNGVLRSVIRGGIKFSDKACELSYPDWLFKKWCCDFGEEKALKIMEALNETVQMTVRVNTLKTTKEDLLKRFSELNINAKPDEVFENSIKVSGLSVLSSKEFADGLFSVQDSAASLAAFILEPKPNENILDLCAAPGGKTTHIAELMENKGNITACDIYEHKTKLIDDSAKRLGIDIIKTRVFDASIEDEAFLEKFDRVLADVPCSGLGIIRRKPEIKWNATLSDELYDLQKKILSNAAKYVKTGGFIVYSTCTLNKYENELRIEEFLAENKNFEAVKHITMYPDELGTDGFFICKLRRIN